MARKNRVTVPDGIYHVTARVAHGAMLFMDGETKSRIMSWAGDIAAFSGVEVFSLCIMDNHLHILVHVPRVPREYWLSPDDEPAAYAFGMRPPERRAPVWRPADGDSPRDEEDAGAAAASARPSTGFTLPDGEMARRLARLRVGLDGAEAEARRIEARWAAMRGRGLSSAVDGEKDRLCRRMYNLSQFVKTLAERVSQRYNETTGHAGCLWQGRFYSGVVEDSADVLAVVAAYIEYNPVKAGIAAKPGSWRWSSYHLACEDGGAAGETARRMYERMLRRPWAAAKAKMEAIFADRLPDGVDARALEEYLKSAERIASGRGRIASSADAEAAADAMPTIRASQTIRLAARSLWRGAYIGRSTLFGDRIASMLPPRFPRPGMRSLLRCMTLSWALPDAA
jgi:REP element-mobilizing transposase RayT